MQQLIKVTQGALTGEESQVRNIQQRNLISDGLRLLNQHEAAMVKGYSMALLEIFAEGPSTASGRGSAEDTGMDFGELTLLDDNEMQAQVELSKAQQSALHATDAVLAELNTLVSAAQGLRSVQPERNPLRPESYIRALQRVVGDTGVPADVRQLWMQHMRDLLGSLLVGEYKKTAASLREHGVQPVGYAVLGTPAGNSGRGGYGGAGMNAGMGTGYGGGYSTYGQSMSGPVSDYGNTGYGRSAGATGGWSGESVQPPPFASEAEEALLTVGILRQMLAGGDPFDPRTHGPMLAQPGASKPGWGPAPQAGVSSPPGSGYYPAAGVAAAEAIEDMAQLERLVGRLASGSQAASLPAPLSAWRGTGVAPVVYATMPMEAATQSPVIAMEVVGRMMENIARDARLLAPVQQAVKRLEPALKQLVVHDGRFFTDGAHPARRLLDDLTQRSLSFPAESAPGFSSFMRLVHGAVDHLTANEIRDAGPFDTVLKALHNAWEAQEQKIKAHQEAQRQVQLQAEQREMLAEKVAADIRRLPDLENVPSDVLDFAAGPWADVIALAQVLKGGDGREEDPGGYLALVPVLLWSAQPELTRHEPDRLNESIPGLLAKLRKGLKTVNYPAIQTSAFLQRLVGLHQAAFEKPVPASAPEAAPEGEQAVSASTDVSAADETAPAETAFDSSQQAPIEDDALDPYADFVIGAWVELVTNGRTVRTQLTWTSPHRTLFLFTAADASTQSMTRRMRDKLAAEGSLRVVPAVTSAPDAAATRASRKATAGAPAKAAAGSRASKSR